MGVGLIGGSLALALKKAKFVRSIIGVGRSEVNLNIARDLRIVDEIVVNLSDAVAEADLIVLAAPLSATRPLFAELRPILSETTILTDVGGVKGGIVKDAEGNWVPHFVALYLDTRLRAQKQREQSPLLRSSFSTIMFC